MPRPALDVDQFKEEIQQWFCNDFWTTEEIARAVSQH
jgi:hypothetical protein